MTINAIPSLVRTSSTFVSDVDTFFGATLPTLVTEINIATEAINNDYNAAMAAGLANAETNAASAAASATSASNNAGIVSAIINTSGVSATSAATSEASAKNYMESAIRAWSSSMAPAETLPSIAKSIHSGVVVKSIVYDTRKDSDGGQWRKRCADKSWYTETLGGTTWLGQAATELAARGANLYTYPEQLDNAAWTKARATITTGFANLNGQMSAFKLTEDATATQTHLIIQVAVLIANRLQNVTVRAKAGERTLLGLDANAMSNMLTVFDLSTGTVSFTGTSVCSATCTTVGGGWYDCTMYYVPTLSTYYPIIRLCNASSAAGITYTGDGTSGLYISHIQTSLAEETLGPNLIGNSAFTSDVNGWTSSRSGTLSHESSSSRLRVTNGAADYGTAQFACTTVVGRLYKVMGTITAGTVGGFLAVGTGTATLNTNSILPNLVSSTLPAYFKATTTTTYVGCQTGSSTAGLYTDFDNITLEEVTPVASTYVPYSTLAGRYFQNTTDKKFYALNSTYGVTEVFRGNVREFPEQVAIVAESARVVIYDLTQVGCPMWMVFVGGTILTAPLVDWNRTSRLISAIAMRDGLLLNNAGSANTGSDAGINATDFCRDRFWKKTATISAGYAGYSTNSISARNTGLLGMTDLTWTTIVSASVNDIAITVLDNAPIDPATGLPVPTIAVATAGGVSIIKDNGTVVNITGASGLNLCSAVGFIGSDLTFNSANYQKVCFGPIPAASTNLANITTGYSRGYCWTGTVPTLIGGAATNPINVLDKATYSSLGLTLLKENPTTPTKSMVDYITNAYNSGWQVGDSRGAWLADTVAGSISTTELLSGDSADFTSGVGNWAASYQCTIASVASQLVITATGVNPYATMNVAVVVGRTYRISVESVASNFTVATSLYLGNVAGLSQQQYGVTPANPGSTATMYITATTTTLNIQLSGSCAIGNTWTVDNVSVTLWEGDRSVKNKPLAIVGTLTKTAVASAAQLVAYSGFTNAAYLEQPYSANLDFGTGDFCFMGWANNSVADGFSRSLLERRGASGALVTIRKHTSEGYRLEVGDGTNTANVVSAAVSAARYAFITALRRGTTLEIYVDGALSATASASVVSGSLSNALATLTIGYHSTNAAFSGSLALWRASATAPSADQIAHIYRTELPLFQTGAQCTLAGTSTAVTALAYSEDTDTLHVGTSWGRSAFKDLLRIESEATTVGAITSLSAGMGAVLTGGATAGYYYQPAFLLRDEVRRKAEARKALGKVPVFFDFDTIAFTSPTTSGSPTLTGSSVVGTPYVGMGITGTGIPVGTTLIAVSGATYTMSANATVTNAGAVSIGQSSYTLQQGYTAKAVYSAGTLKRVGSTKDYTVASDGFRETTNFGTSPGSAVWVSIMAVKV